MSSAFREFLPCTCVLASSPPECPAACIVSFALTPCLTCFYQLRALQANIFHTLVTLVPAKKNTISNAKGKFHGCTAWAVAVNTAAMMPAGVRDLCDQALYTIASVTGTAIMAFISAFEIEGLRKVERGRVQEKKSTVLLGFRHEAQLK